MIGDRITYNPEMKPLTISIIREMVDLLQPGARSCIAIGGESGCGKSTLAKTLQVEIKERLGLNGYIFQMDDYFKLPPGDNHRAREQTIEHVGPQEVKLSLLNTHISLFKEGETTIEKPLVDYAENTIQSETVDLSEADYCIAEGTYVCLLSAADSKVFMEVNYKETEAFRKKRNRDVMSAFNEKVLAIEHHIVKTHAGLADLIIDKNLKIRNRKTQ